MTVRGIAFSALVCFLTAGWAEDKATDRTGGSTPTLTAPTKAPDAASPQKVYIGLYINDIFGVNLADCKFEADFYIWFRWKGNDLEPLNTFQPANGRLTSKDATIEKKIGDWNYASCRATAVFQAQWDLSRFPFDTQTLRLEIEDNESEAWLLEYVADTENIALDPGVKLPGWRITDTSNEIKKQEYNTNYGDTSLPSGNKSVWSRFSFSIQAARPGYGYFFKLCWGLFLAIFIALLAMFIKPTDLDPRFGLGTGAIFAAMANAYVISAALPEDAGPTTADSFFLMALTAIFLTLCESTYSLYLYTSGKQDASRRLDKAVFAIILVSCLIGTLVMAR